MQFIDTIYELLHELQYEFIEQISCESAFFYDHINTKSNSIDIFNFNSNILKQKQILLRTYEEDFNGYICFKNKENLSFSKINYYTIIKIISDNFETLIAILNLGEAAQYFKENKFENSVNDILLEYEIIDKKMDEKKLEKVKKNFFKEFEKITDFHIFFYIPVEIVSLMHKNKSPFYIDYYEHQKHELYNYTDMQFNSKINNLSMYYKNDVSYIDFFEIFLAKKKYDFMMENFVINSLDELEYFDLSLLKNNEKINTNLFLSYINKTYFKMIIEQQKFLFASVIMDAQIDNKNSHSGIEDFVRKKYKIREKNYKKYQTFEDQEFNEQVKCMKEIIKLSKLAKSKENKLKYGTNKIKFLEENLSKKCKDEFEFFSELKFYKNANYFYNKLINKIQKKLQKNIEFKYYQKFIILLFGQYDIFLNKEKEKNEEFEDNYNEYIIKFSPKKIHKKVQKINKKFYKKDLKNTNIIFDKFDLFYLRKVKK